MKKAILAVKALIAVALIAAVAYFARTREVHAGSLSIEGKPLGGVKVRLYKKSDIEHWFQNDFVANFLHWKERREELRKLDEVHGLHEALFATRKTDAHKALSEYKTARTLGYTATEFPDDLFRKMRLDLPSDLFLPAKDLFTYRKEANKDLDKDTYFGSFKADFPETSRYNLIEVKHKFELESWDKILGYKPEFSEKDAGRTIHDISLLDKLAAALQQIALNDREVQHLAPLPLMETTTDAQGRFQFALSRYSKKYADDHVFVVAAVANPTPRRRVAWLRTLKLPHEVKSQAKALLFQVGDKANPWGFYPKQTIALTSDNTVADVSNLDNMVDLEEIIPVDAPMRPMVFENPPSPYNFLEAVALLTTKTTDPHGHGHGHGGHDDHGHDSHHGDSHNTHQPHAEPDPVHPEHPPAPAAHPPAPAAHAPADAHPAPAQPTPVPELEPPPAPEPTPAPPPAAANPTAYVPFFPHIDIIGEWESKADPTQIVSISFSEDGRFAMQIEGTALPSNQYAIDFLKTPHVVTITKADGTHTQSALEFTSTTTIQFDGATYTKKLE